jgi:hypothetical protein
MLKPHLKVKKIAKIYSVIQALSLILKPDKKRDINGANEKSQDFCLMCLNRMEDGRRNPARI